jgi:regulator of RNase E activity RraA
MFKPARINIPAEVMEELKKISAATACGTLMKLGYRNTFMHAINPMSLGQRMMGRARTIRYLPVREDVAKIKVEERGELADFQALEATRPGDVIVCDVGFHGGWASTFGDVMTSRFKYQKGAGLVIDGALRDIGILRTMGVPVFYRETHAVPGPNAIWPWDHDIPIQCGGILVVPGDIIIGDDDGVVAIPQEVAGEVARLGVEEEEMEAFVRGRLSHGGMISDFYPPTEKTRQAMIAARKK